MDEALAILIEDEEPDDGIDLSPAGIQRERFRWRLRRPEHAELYVLWRQLSGMGGESLAELWQIARAPGSDALMADFATLHAREKRLKKRQEFLSYDPTKRHH